MKTLVIAAFTGVIAGLLGALCGVGGGIVMVPAFVTVLGFEQKKAGSDFLGCHCHYCSCGHAEHLLA